MASNQTGRTNRQRQTLLSLCLIAATGLLAYANTFHAPFVLDDISNIVTNPHIAISDLTSESVVNVLNGLYPNRPVVYVTFVLNYLVHGYNVGGYHLVNLIIHILTAALVFLITRQTMRLCHFRAPFLPLGAALLWLVNPVNTQAVTYIVQRMTSLAACFYLLSLYCYIRARRNQSIHTDSQKISTSWYIACGVFMLLGLASKESMAFLPFFIFLYEWFFFQKTDMRWLKHHSRWIIVIVTIFILVAVIYLRGDTAEKVFSLYARKPFNLFQRLLTESQVALYYISLIAFPHPARLQLDYDFPITQSLSDPATALAVLALISLIIIAIYSAGKNRLLSFSILWFLGNLMIESSVLGLAVIYEHRLYLPSVFPLITFVYGLYRFTGNRRITFILVLSMAFIAGTWTYQRNAVWRDNRHLWADNIEKSPLKERPFSLLGLAWAKSGRNYPLAIEYLKTALKLSQASWGKDDPMTAVHHYNLGELYRITRQFDPAIKHYRQALALLTQSGDSIHPGIAAIYNNLGTIQKIKQDLGGAIAYYRKALKALPDPSENTDQVINAAGIYNNLGVAYAEQGNYDMAVKQLKKALALLHAEFGEASPNARRVEKTLQVLVGNRPGAIE